MAELIFVIAGEFRIVIDTCHILNPAKELKQNILKVIVSFKGLASHELKFVILADI
jgi:hypothetical protein